MIKKIKFIVATMLVITIFIIICMVFNKPIKKFLIKKKYEKQIVNNYNNNSFNNVTDGTIEEYNYFKNYYNEPNIDISPLIESYIKQVETNGRNMYNSGGLAVSLTSNMERTIEGGDYTNVTYLYYGIDRKLFIEDLEKILVHKGNDKYTGWCIPKDSPNVIDLPYNYYLKYEPSDFKLLDKVKRITKCTFPNELEIKTGNGRNHIIIEYIDNNNIKQTENSIVYLFDEYEHEIGMFYSGFYFSETHNAKVELHNHYSDKIAEEWQRIHEKDFDDVYWDWDREDCKAIIDKFR